MRWLLLVLTLMLCAWTLSGCASPMRIVCEKPLPLPAEMSEPQSPGAKAFSEKVSNFLPKVESYFKETPEFTTPQSMQ